MNNAPGESKFSCYTGAKWSEADMRARGVRADQAHGTQISDHSVRFTENRGQVIDTDGRARPDIRYTADVNGVKLFFSKHSISHAFYKSSSGSTRTGMIQTDTRLMPVHDDIEVYRMDVVFEGSNPAPRIIAGAAVSGYSNYYLAHCPDGIIRVPSFGKIVYENLYPNIDLVYDALENGTKHEFIVRPGGDPKNIRIRYIGATSLALDEDENLRIESPYGTLNESRPFTHQNGTEIASYFQIAANVVSFAVGDFDSSQPLIIDPWVTYFGGTSSEMGMDLQCDANGNVFGVGNTNSSNFPVQNGHQMTCGCSDLWMSSFTGSGVLRWSTFYGGSSVEGIYWMKLAVDGSGNVVVVSDTQGASFPVTSGAMQTVYAGGMDGVIVKLSNTGIRLWATFAGGSGNDNMSGVTTDVGDNVIFSGNSASTNFPLLNAYQGANAGGKDAVLGKLDAAGQLLWSTYFGGTSTDENASVTMLPSGAIAVGGRTNSTNFPVYSAQQSTNAGSYDCFIASFSSSGLRNWATYYGGSGEESPIDISCDGSGNICVTGGTGSANLPVPNGFQTSRNGTTDGFVALFSATGSTTWATYYGGSSTDQLFFSAFDANGNIYCSGNTSSANLPILNPNQATFGGYIDGFLLALSPTGSRLWATYFGGSDHEDCYGIALGSAGALHCIGPTRSTNLPTLNAHQSAKAGDYDAFFLTLISNGQFGSVQTSAVSPSSLCAGASLQVSFSIGGSFNTANTFTAQLSNSLGSFAAPVPIGTLFSNQAGDIDCTIPSNTTFGTGYRIRVVASSPAVSGTDNGSNLTISPRPTATVTPSGDIPLCPAGSVDLSAGGGLGYTFQWLRNSAPINGATSLSYSATLAGEYRVIVTALGSCADTSAITRLVPATADTTHLVWTGRRSGDWGTKGNWDHPCATPGVGDTVIIVSAGQPLQSIPSADLSVLELNSNSGVAVAGILHISHALVLSAGNIDVTRGLIVIDTSAQILGAGQTKHVVTSDTGALEIRGVGPGARTGAVVFPIGPSISRYTPVTLTNVGTVDNYRVRVIPELRLGGTSGAMINTHAVGLSWMVSEHAQGGSDVTMTLQWNGIDELQGFVRSRSLIFHHDGTAWIPMQQPGYALGSNPYTRTLSNLNSFSPFAVSDSAAQLPVELIAFAAHANESDVSLSWRTQSESNCAGFYIERRIAVAPWHARGFVSGAITSSSQKEYSFTDKGGNDAPIESTVSYRLRQVDIDGTEHLSHGLNLLRSADYPLLLHQNFPNPVQIHGGATARTMFEYRIPHESSARLSVFDIFGREIAVIADGIHAAGKHTTFLDATHFAGGSYICVLVAGTQLRVVHFSIVR